MSQLPRRDFLSHSLAAVASLPFATMGTGQESRREFQLSLSERSLTRRLQDGELDHLDFAEVARSEFDFEAIDYASRFFKDHVDDDAYLTMMNKRAADQGVRQVLLLVDGEGALAAGEQEMRQQAIRNHRRWIDVAQTLGCRAICLAIHGEGSQSEQAARAVNALRRLSEYGVERRVNILLGNDQGLAADPAWLLGVLQEVDSSRCAAFPSFNGFGGRDRYEGMAKLMEVAKGVCATSKGFNGDGNEIEIDFQRMMKVVLDAGYRGYISLEYQGKELDEFAGIRATQALLQRVRDLMT